MKNFYKLFRFLAPYKMNVFGSVFSNILGAFFSLFSLISAIPFLNILFGESPEVTVKPEFEYTVEVIKQTFYYYVTEIKVEQGAMYSLIMILSLVLVMSLFKNLFAYLALYLIAPIRTGVVRDIRNSLYQKVLDLPIGFYSDERKGDIISKMTNDVNEIEVSIIRSLEMCFRDPIIILIHLTALVIMSPGLTIFVFVLLPTAAFIIGRIGRSLRKTSFKGQRKMGAILSIMEETLGGLRVIKAFNAEDKMSSRFQSVNSFYSLLMTKMWRRRDLASPLSEFLGTIVIGLILLYGGVLILDGGKGGLNGAGLIGYVAVFYMIVNPAKSFSSAYFNILKGLASADRIDEILSAENTIKSGSGAKPLLDLQHSIEYRNVSFKYKEEYVLKNVNLTIPRGKSVALVGQSGSGKSTFVDLLPRFYDVMEGEILIDGINIKEYDLKQLRSIMGNVNQDPILFNDNFFNNISFGVLGSTEEQVITAAKIANAHDFITATPNGYYSNIGDRGSKLSGGQRQRVSIARAILKNPPIMILDEATSALDTESERLVQDAIEKLMKNRTSIVIAHRLSTIRNADMICVLHEGEIVETGKHDELLAKGGYYAKLHSLQA
ncbi:MAG: ABC transporter ATP-binding protein [Bacteroidales bacterium]|nr:ABC transporter ATP-binding protein [Bacteroidales bacterium]MBN2748582.1 ABC transporter ATP-binding protein [Bacteroidales bacterium]